MIKNFTCKRCGSCCNPPRLYAQDIERIKKLGYKEEDFIYTDNLKNNYLKDKKSRCMFLKQGKIAKCKIYSSRPKVCRQYPSELVDGSCKPVELAFDRYLENKLKKVGLFGFLSIHSSQSDTIWIKVNNLVWLS